MHTVESIVNMHLLITQYIKKNMLLILSIVFAPALPS